MAARARPAVRIRIQRRAKGSRASPSGGGQRPAAKSRKVGARAFPDQEWVFAIHQDKGHPHAHMVVKMRGRKKDKKLRLNRHKKRTWQK